jgi:myo-inositol-1(or 4)-monophosphatase
VDIRRKMRVIDVAAAYLIVKEAGATITTPEGTPLEAEIGPQQRISLVASGNRGLHEEILRLIREEE